MNGRDLYMKVAGVTFEGRQKYLANLRGDEPVRIVPEPENPYDPNALAVHIATEDFGVAHCGFVPRNLAAEIAPLLDGEAIMVQISEITGGFEMRDGGIASRGLILRVSLPPTGDEDDEAPF